MVLCWSARPISGGCCCSALPLPSAGSPAAAPPLPAQRQRQKQPPLPRAPALPLPGARAGRCTARPVPRARHCPGRAASARRHTSRLQASQRPTVPTPPSPRDSRVRMAARAALIRSIHGQQHAGMQRALAGAQNDILHLNLFCSICSNLFLFFGHARIPWPAAQRPNAHSSLSTS